MRPFQAKITRLQLEPDETVSVWVAGNKLLELAPGQYFQATAPHEPLAVLPHTFYAGETAGYEAHLFGEIPPGWGPGTVLQMHGPLGKGFHLPAAARRLALLSFDRHLSQLLSLVTGTTGPERDVAVFASLPLRSLPTFIEVYPLEAAAEAPTWADFLAIEASPASLPGLAQKLGLTPGLPLPCPGQVLVHLPMPCRGLAECGVCAVPTRNGKPRLACLDGPVFSLAEVLA